MIIIGVDGIHGSGKTTLIRGFISELENRGFPVQSTEFNGDPAWTAAVRAARRSDNLSDPRSYILASVGDLLAQFANMPDAKSLSQIVVCDRYVPSLYARGWARNLSTAWLKTVVSPLPNADAYVWLDTDTDTALQRAVAPSDQSWRVGFEVPGSPSSLDLLAYRRYQTALSDNFRRFYSTTNTPVLQISSSDRDNQLSIVETVSNLLKVQNRT